MNQKTLLILIIIVIFLAIAVFGLWYFYSQQKQLLPEQEEALLPTDESSGLLGPEADYQPNQQAAFRYFLDLALQYKEREYCSKIEDQRQRDICYLKIDQLLVFEAKNLTDCLKLSSKSQNDCLAILAVKSNNISPCFELTGPEQEFCKENFVFSKINENEKELSICDSLIYKKDVCQDLIYMNQGNCDKIKDKDLQQGCSSNLL